jgi:thiamine biosynthesis lipoprotein
MFKKLCNSSFHILLSLICFTGCKEEKIEKFKKYSFGGYTQGTTYNITYIDSTNRMQLVQQKVDSILTEIDNSVSTYNPDSRISKFNNADSCFLIDNHILNLFLLSDEVNAISDGAFDPTVKPLVNLWGFGSNPFKEDSLYNNVSDSINRDSLISAYKDSLAYDLTDFVGFEYILLSGDIVFNTFEEMLQGRFNDNFICKDDSIVQLTFDAIAQGYTADVIGDYLNFELKIGDFLVDIGKEIVAQGYKMDKRPWLVSIEHPNTDIEGGEDELARVRMDSSFRAIAVSGNYRKFKQEGDKKIVHSIDPRNGQPSQNGILSAAVLADEAAIADAYATAFMVMRLEEIIPLVESESINLYVLIVYEDSNGKIQTYVSTNLEDKLLYPIPQNNN